MHMRYMLTALLSVLFLMPAAGWAAKPADKHDCHAEKGGRFVCDRGPLAGKSFANRKAMMEAVSAGGSSDVGRSGAQAVSDKPASGMSAKGKAKVHKKQ
ncbi:MAG: hypothetical protein HZB35_09175 [Nitrospirae bacterium]|nr:hypothetical protein [Nitrospirota bacterium]